MHFSIKVCENPIRLTIFYDTADKQSVKKINYDRPRTVFLKFRLVWFLCLKSTFVVIQCQSHSPRKTVVVLFNP